METRIDQILSRQTETVEDKLAEISRDLGELADRLARVLDLPTTTGPRQPRAYAGAAAINAIVNRAQFDTLPGEVFENHDATYSNGLYWRHPVKGICVFCYEAPKPDHDLRQENAPDEWVRIEPKGTPEGASFAVFTRLGSLIERDLVIECGLIDDSLFV